ncbi:unnamed protein product [Mytilus coruscus]|uniref:Mab-21-like nucleotidyltransferase domain-containing protein n=1 Tax=Mytilus coruscus TaxID=42192 RepID=A0A6J8BM22_MYTCO|nr:unnamed protein product [Mytilus coruscus]
MTQLQITQYFNKTVSTSKTFFSSIWKPCKETQARKDLYESYSKSSKNNYLNDFVNNQTFETDNLSIDNIRRLHVQNIESAVSYSKRAALSLKRSDIEPDSDETFLRRSVIDCGSVTTDCKSKKMYNKPWTPEEYLTDEYLDRLRIPSGDKGKRLSVFYMYSRTMFIYLSYIIGTEKTVRIRRKLINEKFPYDVRILGGYMFASGSRAEGLDMKGSDTDIMVIDGLAYENNIPTGSLITYRYDSMLNGSQPGYVLVQIEVKGYSPEIYASSNVKACFSSVLPFFKTAFSFTPHGPAITAGSCGNDLDIVPCLKSATWPKIASEWIHRKRKYGWPSQEIIKDMESQGCHLVPQFTVSTTMKYLNYYLNDPLSTVNLKKSLNAKYAIEVVKILLDFQRFGKRLLCSMCNSKAKHFKPYMKRILRITFVRTSAIPELCHFMNTEDTSMDNRMRYLMEKVIMELLLSGCRADLSSGKIILASWLYEKKKFKDCLLVTDMALQCIQYRVFHADMITTIGYSLQEVLHNISWSFLFRNLQMFYTVQSNFILQSKLLAKDFSRVLAVFMNLASWDENITRNNLMEFSFYPESYCFFLRFLCHLRLGNGPKSDEAFEKMLYVQYQNTGKYERNMYDLIVYTMRLAGSITKRKLENGTDNDDTISMNDFFMVGQDGIPTAVEKTDFQMLTNCLKNINDFGLNPDFLRNGFAFTHSVFDMCNIQ